MSLKDELATESHAALRYKCGVCDWVMQQPKEFRKEIQDSLLAGCNKSALMRVCQRHGMPMQYGQWQRHCANDGGKHVYTG